MTAADPRSPAELYDAFIKTEWQDIFRKEVHVKLDNGSRYVPNGGSQGVSLLRKSVNAFDEAIRLWSGPTDEPIGSSQGYDRIVDQAGIQYTWEWFLIEPGRPWADAVPELVRRRIEDDLARRDQAALDRAKAHAEQAERDAVAEDDRVIAIMNAGAPNQVGLPFPPTKKQRSAPDAEDGEPLSDESRLGSSRFACGSVARRRSPLSSRDRAESFSDAFPIRLTTDSALSRPGGASPQVAGSCMFDAPLRLVCATSTNVVVGIRPRVPTVERVSIHVQMRRLLPQLFVALVVVGCLFVPAVASADPPGVDLPCSDSSWSWSCGGLGPDNRDLISGQPYHHNFKDHDTQGGATLGVTFSADGTTGYFTSDRGLSDYTVAFCDGTVIDVETVGGDHKTFTFSYDKPIRSIRVKAATTNRTFLSRKCGDDDGGGGGSGGGGTTKLSIVKRVHKHKVRPGETTTFTVVVRNTGAVTATNVQVCDQPDDNWAFVSASPLTPTVTGNVSCFALGDLASGDQTKLRLKLRLDSGVSAGAAVNSAVAWADNADQVKATAKLRIICKTAKITPDLLGVQKVEQTAALEPGQTRTIQVSCPTGFIATDGTPRVDAVDQGAGTLASVHVLAARAVSASTYEMVVSNTSTGRAQLHLFVTCMAGETANQHLAVQQSGPIEQTVSWGAGRQTATLTCPDGSQPIAPGYSLAGGAARIVESEQTGDHAWTLGFVVSEPTTATLSIRCVDQQLGGPSGALHRLEFTHVVTAVDVPAGQAQTAQAICGDQAKGIVATYDLASDLVLLGHDPQPKTRVFYLFNPTAGTLHATLDLVCVSDRTAAAQSCVASRGKHHGRGGKLRSALAERKD